MVIKQSMLYPLTGTDRPLHIYLPDDYEYSGERYPVMYFFDGHNLFFDSDATYGKSWGLKTFLDRWDKKMIIVGIECSHEGYGRLSEYNPYLAKEGFLRDAKAYGDETIRWITEEIKPMIDRKYRTWSHREATAIGGSSMGGIMSIYALVRYNHVFSKGACLSSAIRHCMEPLRCDIETADIHPDTRIYLSWGTKEADGVTSHNETDSHSRTYQCNQAVCDLFLAHHALAMLYCQPGGAHCEADWEKQVPIFMEYLWK